MGIKSFSRFLEDEAPTSLRTVADLRRYRTLTMAIDVSIYMYRFAYCVNSTPTTCARQFIRMHERLSRAHVHPVYVFDGRPNAQKRDVIRQRVRRREQQAARAPRERPRVTAEHFATLKTALRLGGASFLQARGDAEKACAWLCLAGLAHVVASNDYDALAYGAPVMVRNINCDVLTEIDRSTVLAATGLSEERFLYFCVLCGCDYTPRGFRLGVRRALVAARNGVPPSDAYGGGQLDAALSEFHDQCAPLDARAAAFLPCYAALACQLVTRLVLLDHRRACAMDEETEPPDAFEGAAA